MDEEELSSSLQDLEEKYHKKLCRIYDKANTSVIIETIQSFTSKVKDIFENLVLENNTASKTYNYNELRNLSKLIILP